LTKIKAVKREWNNSIWTIVVTYVIKGVELLFIRISYVMMSY